ncbi:unnamed protein product [Moneuplotes crassus]|uniref:U3 small nucleolar RNA-associated protein 11 n=1 Tax=Euplotes crassus TaxID=5936 RepID=A0AAD1XVI6_EUPCR|nr:unnamed protein product [Moneuplotes crassus]
MSSPWKNFIPKRKYRERRQLSSRKHLGMLEKKQDYKKRAVDYHQKSKQMEKLREKVINKNPDEFYYNMINSKMVNGEHKIKGSKVTDEFKKNLKLLDFTRMVQKKRTEKLQSQLHLVDVEKPNNHIYFVSSKKEIKRKAKELQKRKEKIQEKKEEMLADIVFHNKEEEYAILQQNKKKAYHSAAQAMKRENVLTQMKNALEMDNKIKSKGKKRKVVDKVSGKETYVWFSQRKK